MNILPKKSWHVKNRKNIERVLRDEAEAERLAKIERDKRLQAEQEARIRELRARAGILESKKTEKHINLFETHHHDYQESKHDESSHKEQLEEARLKQRSQAINRLVRSEDVNKPWYCQSRIFTSTGSIDVEKSIIKPDSITSIYDPMIAIKQAEEIYRRKRALNKQQYVIKKTSEGDKAEQIYQYSSSNQSALCLPSYSKDSILLDNRTPEGPLSDSSPEIIKIVDRDDKKVSKRHHSKSKSRKRSKSHHRHQHHHHKDHKRHKRKD